MTDYQNELVMEHLDLVNWVIRTRISVPNRPLLKSLTRAVVLECIEKVVIHKDEKLEIIFEHSEDYARLVSSLQEYAARGILEEAM